ncbi:winged helix-turn-helix domain-containing protein [Microbacterium sp. B2969]|uniref:Winged helix-turn-helix domain-containing protein n=1 Tax=Microbacterium alkaliflavum TaxID=3248839 RepID=A0ABW7Q3S1_9MICO
MLPSEDETADELLRLLAERPGYRGTPGQCYGPLAKRFPQITDADLRARVQSGDNHWENRVRFARNRLVKRGLIFKPGEGTWHERGVWELTSSGIDVARRLGATGSSSGSGVTGSRASRGVVVKSMAQESDGILLGWNRDVWDDWPDTYEGMVNRLMAGDRYTTRWSVGKRLDVPPKTEAWLLRQGGPFGLIGHGIVTSNTFVDAHFANDGETSRYVNVEFDVLLPESDLLPRDQLEHLIPEVKWRHQFTSGNRVPAPVNARLKQLWNGHTS